MITSDDVCHYLIFYSERVMLSWNKLSSDVKKSQSLYIFKSNLELFKN